MKFILASGSLRRQELLQRLGMEYQILVSEFDENSVPYEGDPETYVKTLAMEKARNILDIDTADAYILGADTVVCVDGRILGKPLDRKDAFNMIRSLQARSHEVYSGIALINGSSGICETLSVMTSVQFSPMTDEEIEIYLEKGEWHDKAGAYGIQGSAGLFIEGIEGDYYNVMGLPLNTLYKMLRKHHIIM